MEPTEQADEASMETLPDPGVAAVDVGDGAPPPVSSFGQATPLDTGSNDASKRNAKGVPMGGVNSKELARAKSIPKDQISPKEPKKIRKKCMKKPKEADSKETDLKETDSKDADPDVYTQVTSYVSGDEESIDNDAKKPLLQAQEESYSLYMEYQPDAVQGPRQSLEPLDMFIPTTLGPRKTTGHLKDKLPEFSELLCNLQEMLEQLSEAHKRDKAQAAVDARRESAKEVKGRYNIRDEDPGAEVLPIFEDYDDERFTFELRKEWRPSDLGTKTMTAVDMGTSSKGMMPQRNNEKGIRRTAMQHMRASVHRRMSCSERIQTTLQPLVINPAGKRRITWDACGAVLLGYDIIVVPLGVFDLPQNLFLSFMSWFTLLYWMGDVLLSFLTGYMRKGKFISDVKRIAAHYTRTWLPIDLLILTVDWTVLILSMTMKDSNAGRMGKMLKMLRIIRTVRLVRLGKLQRIMSIMQDLIPSESLSIILNMIKLILLLLVLNHVIACTWYLIGVIAEKHPDKSWIRKYSFDEENMDYVYATAVHWSLTQFTPASMAVQPQNTTERTFAVMLLVVGLIIFSSFISSITSSMTALRNMHQDGSKQFWLLRCYLRDRDVSTKLSVRIQKFLEYALERQKERVAPEKVKILCLLSQGLQDELQFEITMPHLAYNPLFAALEKRATIVMHKVTNRAVCVRHHSADEIVFYTGGEATQMIDAVTGDVAYVREVDEEWEIIGSEMWLCEHVLWTTWRHVGELKALTECDLLRISPDEFSTILVGQPDIFMLAMEYAEYFVRELNNNPYHELSDLRDKESAEELVSKIPSWQTNGARGSSHGALGMIGDGVNRFLHRNTFLYRASSRVTLSEPQDAFNPHTNATSLGRSATG